MFIDSEQLATAFDSDTSTWIIAIWVSAAVWFATGLLIAIAAGARFIAVPSQRRTLGPAAVVVWFVLMTAAAVGAVTIPVAASAQVRDLLDGEGRIEIFDETWCLSFEHGSNRVEDTDDCDYVLSNDGFEERASPTPTTTPMPTATPTLAVTQTQEGA